MYHAPLAASQTGRWLYCPGSIPFIQQLREIVPETPSPHADEGTRAHSYLDKALHAIYKPYMLSRLDYLQNKPYLSEKEEKELLVAIYGKKGSYSPKEVKEAMSTRIRNLFKDQWAIDVAIEYVQDRMAFNPSAKIFLENYVKPLPMVDDCGGTSDIIILTEKELEIIDYKHGRGVFVSPRWNTQLLTYALGAIELTDIPVRRVKTTIVQPRHSEALKQSPQGNGVMSVVYDREDITVKFADQLRKGIARVREVTKKCESPTFTLSKAHEQGYLSPGPGRKGCRFCDLKTFCPAIQDGVTDVVATMKEFENLDIRDSAILDEEVIKRIYELYCAAPELKQMASAAEDMVLQLLELDEPPPYLTERLNLETRYGNRAWVKPQADVVAQMLKLGVEKKHLFDVKLKTVPNMLKLLPKATQAQLKEYIGRPNNGNKVVAK